MCGRYALTKPPTAVRGLFDYVNEASFPPRFNIAPTQPVGIIRCEKHGDEEPRVFSLVHWGLLPPFVKDVKRFPLLFNARAETVLEKASFRNAIRRRRCLFPMDGYYEWQAGVGRTKQPFLIRRHGGALFAAAGLWESLMTADGSEIDTACIITTAANGVVAGIHERMPAVIDARDFSLWLDPDERNTMAAIALLQPAANDGWEIRKIASTVNWAGNDDESIQTELEI